METPNPASYTYDDATITFANPVRKGYTFDGWSGTGIDGLTNEVVIAHHSHGDRAYAAHWTMIPLPPYLDNAADDVFENYYAWADTYGYDSAGEHEVAFLLDAAPGAVTNGVTPLKIVELGVTNRLVSESGDYGLVAQEMLGYREDDYLTYRRIVLASDVTELTQRSAFGYQGDICNGYLVLHIGIDLSEPRENWLAFSWPCEVVDGQVVLEFTELLLEKYRESVARDTGKPCNSLFFSASISTQQGDPPYELMAAIYQAMDQGGYEESEP